MSFNIQGSKNESLLIVGFKTYDDGHFPYFYGEILHNESGLRYVTFMPFEIIINESLGDTSSVEKWIDSFLNEKPISGGANISFFELDKLNILNKRRKIILSLNGCSMKSVEIKNNKPCVTIEFFNYSIPMVNGC